MWVHCWWSELISALRFGQVRSGLVWYTFWFRWKHKDQLNCYLCFYEISRNSSGLLCLCSLMMRYANTANQNPQTHNCVTLTKNHSFSLARFGVCECKWLKSKIAFSNFSSFSFDLFFVCLFIFLYFALEIALRENKIIYSQNENRVENILFDYDRLCLCIGDENESCE